jgi:hypothetical protein
MVNSNAQSQDASILLAHAETDALLQQVTEQIDLDNFDVNDADLLKRLVECLGDCVVRKLWRKLVKWRLLFCWMLWEIMLIRLCGVLLVKL